MSETVVKSVRLPRDLWLSIEAQARDRGITPNKRLVAILAGEDQKPKPAAVAPSFGPIRPAPGALAKRR